MKPIFVKFAKNEIIHSFYFQRLHKGNVNIVVCPATNVATTDLLCGTIENMLVAT